MFSNRCIHFTAPFPLEYVLFPSNIMITEHHHDVWMRYKVLMFERKHMIGILLFVHDKGGCTRMELYNGVANNDRMPDKLALLEEQGLIVQKEVPISHAMRIDMTEKGERFVALLKEADSLLS